MVASIDEDGPPPPELQLYWMCERFHSLPDEGAIYQQDAALIHRMSFFDNVYRSLSRLRNAHGEEIHGLSESDRTIPQILVDMGLLFNA